MATRLKICGITALKDAMACAELGVDFLGFNFFKGSPRYIKTDLAKSIIQNLPPEIQSVAIMVQPKFKDVTDVIEQSGIGWVQIIDPQDFIDFSNIPVPVIITKRIGNTITDNYELNGARMLLLDTFSHNELGGSGKIFDWSLIPDSIPRTKLVLGGGITPDNVKEALIKVNPAVIDVASGAEIKPGVKDLEKVRKLVKIIKGN